LVYRINPDGAGKVIAEAVLPEWPATLGSEFSQALFSQQCQHSLLQLPYKAVQDVVAAYQDVSPPLLSALANWGVRAKVVVPILQQSESWGFIIAHQCSDTRLWAEIELELLTQIAAHVSISIAQAERQQQLTASNKVECIG
jgi:GAF domain-containing protein